MSALPGGVSSLVPDGATGFTPNPKLQLGQTRPRVEEEAAGHRVKVQFPTRSTAGNENGNVAIGDRINHWREADKERREARNNRSGGNRFAWESSESVYWKS